MVYGDFVLKKKVQGKRNQGEVVIIGPGEITGEDDDVIYNSTCI